MSTPSLKTRPLLLALTAFLLASPLIAQSAPPKVGDGDLQFANLGSCPLQSGQKVQECTLGYRTWGKLNPDSSNAILVPMWFTGISSQFADLIGPGKLLDPTTFYIIVVDPFADGISISPSNSKSQPRTAFPAVTIHDMVQAEHRLASETLHLRHLHAVLGVSMGGMQTFEWMTAFPDFLDLAIPIVGSTRLTSYDLLLWQAEEDAVRTDPAWNKGNYQQSPPLPQVSILHDMNLTSPAHYARSYTRQAFPAQFQTYFTTGSSTFDANNRLYQLEAMIHHDIAAGGPMEAAAKRVQARVLIIASQQDHMVNPAPAIEFSKLLNPKTTQLLILTSDCGHLAPFQCEADKTIAAVTQFLTQN